MSGRVRLAAGALRLELAPEIGGSVAAFDLEREGGHAAILRRAPQAYDDVLESACFPLVPYSNRIRNGRFVFRGSEVELKPNLPPQPHPLHGTGWRAPWRVEAASDDRAVLAYDHPAGAWPWGFRARQSFTLDERGLDLLLEVENAADGPMPAGLGFHPYFPCGPDTRLTAPVSTVHTVDEEVMPVAREPAEGRYALDGRLIDRADLDNGYEGWNGEAVIERPAEGLTLRLTSPGTTRFQVWSPPYGGVFCAEPVTHVNDAFSRPEAEWPDLGVRVLEPGERFALAARLTVEG